MPVRNASCNCSCRDALGSMNQNLPVFVLLPDSRGVPPNGPANWSDGLSVLREINRMHLSEREEDSRLDARIASYEMAARLQLSAPEVMDMAGESDATKKLYGLDREITSDMGRRCLVASSQM